MTDDCLRLKDGRGNSELHQHDGGSGNRNGRRCVHGDAERAMVCLGGIGMEVRNLNDGEERKQDQTQNGNDWPSG